MEEMLTISLDLVSEEEVEKTAYSLILNDEKKVVWMNESASRFFKYDTEIEKYIHPESLIEWYSSIDKVKTADIKKFTMSLVGKRQEKAQFVVYAIYNDWSNAYFMLLRLMETDISLGREYNQTLHLMDLLQKAVFIANKDGVIFNSNITAKRFIHNDNQFTVNHLLDQFFELSNKDIYLRRIQNGETFIVPISNPAYSKQYMFIYTRDDELDIDVFILRPINQEPSLPKLNEQAAATIVHEIRNPITILLGIVDLLKVDDVKSFQYLALIESEIKRMDQMLSNMLNIFKPKMGNYRLQFNDFFQQIIHLVEVEADSRNIEINYYQPFETIELLANELSLTQIFMNLLKNSMQAIEQDGKIIIDTQILNGQLFEICIIDSGKGMSEDVLNNIFSPYFTTKEQGTGLGLSVVKKLLEDMDGHIVITSEIGKGTIVTIHLPLARNDANLLEKQLIVY